VYQSIILWWRFYAHFGNFGLSKPQFSHLSQLVVHTSLVKLRLLGTASTCTLPPTARCDNWQLRCTCYLVTTIRLRFDARSTVYQRSLSSQWRNPLAAVTPTYLFIYLGRGAAEQPAHTGIGVRSWRKGVEWSSRCQIKCCRPNHRISSDTLHITIESHIVT